MTSAAVPGTEGYNSGIDRFRAATQAISFDELHGPFLPFLPVPPAAILDVGAGVGRDAAHLAALGHQVIAVEPLAEFLEIARRDYASADVTWLQSALPDLDVLPRRATFDFILVSAVWHHLDQREEGLQRLSQLLKPNGCLAISLRHGPAGRGTFCLPIDTEDFLAAAASLHLCTLLSLRDQPSLLPGKPKVRWDLLVLRRLAT